MNYFQSNFAWQWFGIKLHADDGIVYKINRVNYVCSVELFLIELLTKKISIMKNSMSDNYNPTAIGTMLPMRIIMWIMLANFVGVLCSLCSYELENRK